MSHVKTIYTIGHSTHPLEIFIGMLQSFDIRLLVDVRNFPGSRKFPQFNKEGLEGSLAKAGIQYIHLKALGGRRKPLPDSPNKAWRSAAFRGYADYMATPEFQDALRQLIEYAQGMKTVYMCSEAVWWRCHRSLISDILKVNGWTVMHIMAAGKATEHPYTSAASLIDGKLSYQSDSR